MRVHRIEYCEHDDIPAETPNQEATAKDETENRYKHFYYRKGTKQSLLIRRVVVCAAARPFLQPKNRATLVAAYIAGNHQIRIRTIYDEYIRKTMAARTHRHRRSSEPLNLAEFFFHVLIREWEI